ncbi:DUF4263 domain-containing protein [Vibrio parahaemolyticus]|uniref:Shedu immune nuclease family protein n=1 Tax=Vibrio parahaemolyticus TaxID=670 RepID=UPI003FB60107|nr:DUF4263 domain-containing protein [Vibrio parahaemolyticus]
MSLSKLEAKKLEEDFLKLLDEEHGEQVYQEFLEQNSALIPREFIQNHGLHFDLVMRKMSLAKDYTPDFFYMSKSSADWNLVLVEIEKPQSKYFKNEKHDLHGDFLAGLDQIARWRAWFDNSSNKDAFINGTIDPIRVPSSMRRNPCHIKYVLVHGRRSEFEGNDIKKGLIRARETDDFKIMSYDSLVESLHTKDHLYVGVRKNEVFEIRSPHFAGENIFSWVDPSYLKITATLKAEILAQRSSWVTHSLKGGFALDHILPNIGECDA